MEGINLQTPKRREFRHALLCRVPTSPLPSCRHSAPPSGEEDTQATVCISPPSTHLAPSIPVPVTPSPTWNTHLLQPPLPIGLTLTWPRKVPVPTWLSGPRPAWLCQDSSTLATLERRLPLVLRAEPHVLFAFVFLVASILLGTKHIYTKLSAYSHHRKVPTYFSQLIIHHSQNLPIVYTETENVLLGAFLLDIYKCASSLTHLLFL